MKVGLGLRFSLYMSQLPKVTGGGPILRFFDEKTLDFSNIGLGFPIRYEVRSLAEKIEERLGKLFHGGTPVKGGRRWSD
ncbi:hypothetical protein GBA52_019528 [Prunus armeniaca]|nr:hypothetical protein GBA52_019528 [Prunus armeniaca]